MTDIVTAFSNKLENWNVAAHGTKALTGSVSRYDAPDSIRTARMRSLNPLQLPVVPRRCTFIATRQSIL